MPSGPGSSGTAVTYGGAWASIIISGSLWFITDNLWGWELPAQYLLYTLGGFSAVVIVSKLTPPLPKEKLDRFYTILHTPVGQEQKLRDAEIEVILE